MKDCLNDKLTELLEEMYCEMDDLYEIQSKIKAVVDEDYGADRDTFLQEIMRNDDYYNLASILEYCFDNMLD